MTIDPFAIPEPLPSSATWGHVVGRVVHWVADTTGDADDDPEAYPVEGTVTFTPRTLLRSVDDPAPYGAWAAQGPETFELIDGWVSDREGRPQLALVAGVYRVRFDLRGGAIIAPFDIEVTAQHTVETPLNLRTAVPWQPPIGAIIEAVEVPAGGLPGQVLARTEAGTLVWQDVPIGPANELSVGTVTEGPLGATITGDAPSQTLNLTLPAASDTLRAIPGAVGVLESEVGLNRSTNLYYQEGSVPGIPSDTDGAVVPSAARVTSRFIAVKPGTAYRISGGGARLAWYDARKEFISSSVIDSGWSAVHPRTSPENARYVRLAAYTSGAPEAGVDVLQMNEGTELLPYERGVPPRIDTLEMAPPQLVGTGQPDGRVTAPVGAFFFDTAGAALWIKKSGTGSSGWGPVGPPDTGLVPLWTADAAGVTTFGALPEGWTSTGSTWRGAGIWLRRVGVDVELTLNGVANVASASLPLPAWARVDWTSPWSTVSGVYTVHTTATGTMEIQSTASGLVFRKAYEHHNSYVSRVRWMVPPERSTTFPENPTWTITT